MDITPSWWRLGALALAVFLWAAIVAFGAVFAHAAGQFWPWK